ncbi:hypothetical protein MMPV_000541 [Pyropia vietnamensis]
MGAFAVVCIAASTATAALLFSASPTGASSAACSTVNFQSFATGQATTGGSGGPGVPRWRMRTTKPRDRTTDVSAAMDTTNPPPGDEDLVDLCSPRRMPPCKPLGMVAVAVEGAIGPFRAACAAACGEGSTPKGCAAACAPDDDGLGATFRINWEAAVSVNYVRLLDINAGETVNVTVGRRLGAPEDSTIVSGPGDDLNLLKVPMGGVVLPVGTPLTVTCFGSCALVDVGYCAAAVGTPTPSASAVSAAKAATRKPIVLAPISLGILPRDAVRSSTRTFPVGSGTPFEDLFLLSDVTGSMSSAIITVRDELPKIVSARSAVSGSVHFGVGSYRDELDVNYGWILDQPITGDTAAVRSAVANFEATRGGDGPEANLVALHRLATLPPSAIGWREGARRVVAWFGDFPGHEPSCIDGGRTKLTRERVAQELKAAFITVLGVSLTGSSGLDGPTTPYGVCNSGGDPRLARTGQGSFITAATGGRTISLESGSSKVVVDLLSAVDQLDLELTAVTSGCDGVFQVSFDPPLPRTVSPGTSVTVTQTITVDERVCAALSNPDAPFSCSIDYRASGGSFASQKVASQAITGC